MKLKRLARWTTGALTALIVVAIAMLIFGDLSRFRSPLEANASKALGRSVSVGGSIRFVPSLPPKLVLRDVRIANPEWATSPHLLQITELRLALDARELLNQSLKVQGAEIDGFELHLEKNADGLESWLLSTPDGSGPIPLESLRLRNGFIAYVDRAQGRSVNVAIDTLVNRLSDDDLSLRAQAAFRDRAYDIAFDLDSMSVLLGGDQASPIEASVRTEGWSLTMQGELRAGDPLTLSLQVRAEVEHLDQLNELLETELPEIEPIEASAQVTATPTEIRATQVAVDLAGHLLHGEAAAHRGEDSIEITVALEADDLDYGTLAEQLGFGTGLSGTAASTTLELSADARDPRDLLAGFGAHLAVQGGSFQLKRGAVEEHLDVEHLAVLVEEGGLSELSLTGGFRGETLSLQLTDGGKLFDSDPARAWPISAVARFADLDLKAQGGVVNPFDGATLDLSIAIEGPSIGTLAKLAGSPSLASPIAFELTGQLHAAPQELAITELAGKLGDNSFRGDLSRTAGEGRPKLRGRLETDTLNLSQIVSLTAGFSLGQAPAEDAKPLEVLRHTDAELSFSASRFVSAWGELGALKAEAALSNGTLRLDPIETTFGETPLVARLSLDASADEPAVRVELSADGLDLGALSAALGSEERIRGVAGMLQATLDSRGHTPHEFLGNLEVHARLEETSFGYTDETLEIAFTEVKADVRGGPQRALEVQLQGLRNDQPLELSASSGTFTDLRRNQTSPLSLSFQSANTSVRADGTLEHPLALDGFALTVRIEGDDASTLSEWLPLGWPLEGSFLINTDLYYSGRVLELQNLDAALGGSDVSGTARFDLGPRRRAEAELQSKTLLFEDVLRRDSRSEDIVSDDDRVIPSVPLQSSLPSGWEGQVRWTADELRLGEHRYSDIELESQLEGEHFTLSQVGQAPDTGGHFNAELYVDPRLDPPASLRFTARSLDVGWLLPDHDELVHWPADIHFEIEGPAYSSAGLLGYGNGRLEFVAGSTLGESGGFDRWKLDLFSLMLPSGEAPQDRIKCLVVNANIENGVAHGDGAVLETSHVTVAGGGMVDLRSEKLAIVLTPRPKEASLLSIATTVQVGGTLNTPEIAPAAEDIVLATGKLLLGVANPFSLLGSYVIPNAGESEHTCAAAFTAAKEEAAALDPETESSWLVKDAIEGVSGTVGTLFNKVLSGRDTDEPESAGGQQ